MSQLRKYTIPLAILFALSIAIAIPLVAFSQQPDAQVAIPNIPSKLLVNRLGLDATAVKGGTTAISADQAKAATRDGAPSEARLVRLVPSERRAAGASVKASIADLDSVVQSGVPVWVVVLSSKPEFSPVGGPNSLPSHVPSAKVTGWYNIAIVDGSTGQVIIRMAGETTAEDD